MRFQERKENSVAQVSISAAWDSTQQFELHCQEVLRTWPESRGESVGVAMDSGYGI
jgi:hypothetical protein